MTQDKRRDELAKKLHQIYSDEVWRQHQQDPSREVRWQLPYEELPENIKELDRVLADFILAREKKMLEEIEKPLNNAIAYGKRVDDSVDRWKVAQVYEDCIDECLATINKYKGGV